MNGPNRPPGSPAAALAPSSFVDSDHSAVIDFARDAIGRSTDPVDRAIQLFERVRDGYRYNPYRLSPDPADYRASAIVATAEQWCVPKAVLLTAASRAIGIPARLGFADVRNHLTSERLAASMGTDLFAWHGYSMLWLPDRTTGHQRWFKLSSAFNIELCQRFGVKVLDFDGRDDALMHPFDEAGRRHMEYVRDRGVYDDLPFASMMSTFSDLYGSMLTEPTVRAGNEGNEADYESDDPFLTNRAD